MLVTPFFACSSVEVERLSGPEYVVYEPSQIGAIRVHSLCTGGGCLLLDESAQEIILGLDYTGDFADFGGRNDYNPHVSVACCRNSLWCDAAFSPKLSKTPTVGKLPNAKLMKRRWAL